MENSKIKSQPSSSSSSSSSSDATYDQNPILIQFVIAFLETLFCVFEYVLSWSLISLFIKLIFDLIIQKENTYPTCQFSSSPLLSQVSHEQLLDFIYCTSQNDSLIVWSSFLQVFLSCFFTLFYLLIRYNRLEAFSFSCFETESEKKQQQQTKDQSLGVGFYKPSYFFFGLVLVSYFFDVFVISFLQKKFSDDSFLSFENFLRDQPKIETNDIVLEEEEFIDKDYETLIEVENIVLEESVSQIMEFKKVFMILFWGPIQEEIVFRLIILYLFYRRREDKNLIKISLLTSVIFSLFHLMNFFSKTYLSNPIYIFFQIFFGFEVGFFYSLYLLMSNNVVHVMIFHVVNNIVAGFVPMKKVSELSSPILQLSSLYSIFTHLVFIMILVRYYMNSQKHSEKQNHKQQKQKQQKQQQQHVKTRSESKKNK